MKQNFFMVENLPKWKVMGWVSWAELKGHLSDKFSKYSGGQQHLSREASGWNPRTRAHAWELHPRGARQAFICRAYSASPQSQSYTQFGSCWGLVPSYLLHKVVFHLSRSKAFDDRPEILGPRWKPNAVVIIHMHVFSLNSKYLFKYL